MTAATAAAATPSIVHSGTFGRYGGCEVVLGSVECFEAAGVPRGRPTKCAPKYVMSAAAVGSINPPHPIPSHPSCNGYVRSAVVSYLLFCGS